MQKLKDEWKEDCRGYEKYFDVDEYKHRMRTDRGVLTIKESRNG